MSLDRSVSIKRCLADGSISQAEYDSFFSKLTGKEGVEANASPSQSVAAPTSNLTDTSFAIAPLGPGARKIKEAPNVISLGDPYSTAITEPSQLRNHFWKHFAEITKDWPDIIQTPEGPIAWSKSKAGNKLRSFKDGEPARLHYIAAANLPELLVNSRLASVHEEAKGDRTVQEIHRRYAWAEFPNGQRRHVLLTVERMSEHADKDKQNADQAYSTEILGVSLEVLPEHEDAGVVNLKIGEKTNSSSNQAVTPARDELTSFLAGIKPEHRFSGNDQTSFSIGRDDGPVVTNLQLHERHQNRGSWSRAGITPEIPGGSETENRRRISEDLARGKGSGRESYRGDGSESVVFLLQPGQVLKRIKPTGVFRYQNSGGYSHDHSFAAVAEKAHVINAMGGMPTSAFEADGHLFLIQDEGTPISQKEYEELRLPGNIAPSQGKVFRMQIDGKHYLISDLHKDNFMKDAEGKIRLTDLVTGEVTTGTSPLRDISDSQF